eukprot:366105-Chlamydomonas_euryale.AAC.4
MPLAFYRHQGVRTYFGVWGRPPSGVQMPLAFYRHQGVRTYVGAWGRPPQACEDILWGVGPPSSGVQMPLAFYRHQGVRTYFGAWGRPPQAFKFRLPFIVTRVSSHTFGGLGPRSSGVQTPRAFLTSGPATLHAR